LIQQHYLKQN